MSGEATRSRIIEIEEPEYENNVGGSNQRWVINPQKWYYKVWMAVLSLCCLYSFIAKLLQFAFPITAGVLRIPEMISGVVCFCDIIMQCYLAYQQRPITRRYFKLCISVDVAACIPWETIKDYGIGLGFLSWFKILRLLRVHEFFKNLEKDMHVNYFYIRPTKIILMGLLWAHTAACGLYFLATSLPPGEESNTWIGSLNFGGDYSKFKEFGFLKVYTTSYYFSTVTMTTVGYGDMHAANLREMIFIIIYLILGMILTTYLIGNLTILIANGSKTSEMRNNMANLFSYMKRNGLSREIHTPIKEQLHLQYRRSYTEAAVFKDIPVSIHSQIFRKQCEGEIEKVSLFRGCSSEFINNIACRLHEEFFLPGEVIMESGTLSDNLYFVCYGVLEEHDGLGGAVSTLKQHDCFGECSIFYHAIQPYTVKAIEWSRILRIDKQSILNILEIFPIDNLQILENLAGKESSSKKVRDLIESDESYEKKRKTELIVWMNTAAYQGDVSELEALINAGADRRMTNYDGRSMLHIAAARGHAKFVEELIVSGFVDINGEDNRRCTPLLEAVKNRHLEVAGLLVNNGVDLSIDSAGIALSTAVQNKDDRIVSLMLLAGCDPNFEGYDGRTPLHLAASLGSNLMASMLLAHGASKNIEDRWGNKPFDDAGMFRISQLNKGNTLYYQLFYMEGLNNEMLR